MHCEPEQRQQRRRGLEWSPYETITALSPAVGPNGQGTYYSRSKSNGLDSALTSTAASGSGFSAPVFTYSVLVPIVTGVMPAPPATVAVGGSITINGYNFVTGVTVGFCPVTNTSPYYSTSCVGSGQGGQNMTTNFTIVSTTQMVVTVPSSLAAWTTYYPIVGVSPIYGRRSSRETRSTSPLTSSSIRRARQWTELRNTGPLAQARPPAGPSVEN